MDDTTPCPICGRSWRQCRDERWAQLDREKKLEMLAAGGLADIARRDGKDFPAGGSR